MSHLRSMLAAHSCQMQTYFLNFSGSSTAKFYEQEMLDFKLCPITMPSSNAHIAKNNVHVVKVHMWYQYNKIYKIRDLLFCTIYTQYF